jgi:hypothetical protein
MQLTGSNALVIDFQAQGSECVERNAHRRRRADRHPVSPEIKASDPRGQQTLDCRRDQMNWR